MGLFWRGLWDEAIEAVHLGVANEPAGALVHWDAAIALCIHAYRGEEAEALRLFDERRHALPKPDEANHFGALLFAHGAAEALWVLGRDEDAGALYPILASCPSSTLNYSIGLRTRETFCAAAAAAGGDWDRAEEHFVEAIRLAEELPIVTEQADARRLFARMLRHRDAVGDRERARGFLGEAIAIYEKVGMPRHVEMSEAMLKDL
jgi:tetratricopeptide (TPR) repeat protein